MISSQKRNLNKWSEVRRQVQKMCCDSYRRKKSNTRQSVFQLILLYLIIIQTKTPECCELNLYFPFTLERSLGYKSGSCWTFVLPDRGQHTLCFVVSGQSVDTGFNQNQTELGVLVLAVHTEMLADGNSLFDQEIKILWQLRGQTLLLEDAQDFVASDKADLGNSMRISEDDTYGQIIS